MPRAAIISFCERTGQIRVLTTCALDPDGSQPEGIEIDRPLPASASAHLIIPPTEAGMTQLVKLLRRIAPIMPDGSYRPTSGPDPSRAGVPVQRFTNPAAARGVKRGSTRISQEELLDIIDGIGDDDLPPTKEPSNET